MLRFNIMQGMGTPHEFTSKNQTLCLTCPVLFQPQGE